MISFAREKVQEISKLMADKSVGGYKKFVLSFLRGMFLGSLILIFGGYVTYRVAYFEKVLPGLLIASIDLSGASTEEALYVLGSEIDDYIANNPDLTLTYEEYSWSLPLKDFDVSLDEEGTKNILMSFGRSGSLLKQLSDQWRMFYVGENIPLSLSMNVDLLNDFVATASAEISNPAIPPRVYKGEYYNPDTKSVIVAEKGVPGDEVNTQEIIEVINARLSRLENIVFPLSTSVVVDEVTNAQLERSVERAKKLLGKSLLIKHNDEQTKDNRKWTLYDKDLISFLSIVDDFNTEKIDSYVALISESVDRPSQNALFQFDEYEDKVVSFKPAKNGLSVQTDKLRLSLQEEIESLIENSEANFIEVAVYETAPTITNSEVNDLGIQTLLGHGESTYYHSSVSRRHNVEFAAGKLNGVLVPPGEEFSFNRTLGEVSQATGFKQALIIKEGRTLLDDGGGVCQDSTTMFRAILDAGLPITSWQNHSFRVGYYEQNSKPGFDATVFSPAPDLRFINDTPNHILIQTRANNMKLEYDLFGTDDERRVTISNYAQWDASPPPPDLYQDDPTLPAGEIKKVESAVPGLKTKFDYTVTRDGETIFEKTFYSVYQPWQAVYMRGTGG